MKPKDLNIPFPWKERRPYLYDKMFYVPAHYSKHADFPFPGWDHSTLFDRPQPIKIEYCSGNGLWLVEKAKIYPNFNWVGVDIDFERVRKIWIKAKKADLSNLFIVCGDALTLSSHYIPSESIEEIFINFPDPWPKKRHHKHRIIQNQFVKEIERTLKPKGKMTFVTDDEDYRDWTLNYLSQSALVSLYPTPFYRTDITDYGVSTFDLLWRDKGRTIFHLHHQKDQTNA